MYNVFPVLIRFPKSQETWFPWIGGVAGSNLDRGDLKWPWDCYKMVTFGVRSRSNCGSRRRICQWNKWDIWFVYVKWSRSRFNDYECWPPSPPPSNSELLTLSEATIKSMLLKYANASIASNINDPVLLAISF